jgi:hypothetical protein
VFTTPREALLREKPSASARILSRLRQGTRLTLVEQRERFLKVESAGLPPAWVSRSVVVVFQPGDRGTNDLLAVGRVLQGNDGNQKLAAALLDRAARRFADAKTPNAEAEVLAGESAEAAAVSGGAAFDRALTLLSGDRSPEALSLRERAAAGRLRARYPEVSTALPTLAEDTSAWLDLVETARSPEVLRPAAERAGAASLTLGRYLLALGKLPDLSRLSERLRSAGARVQSLLSAAPEGRRLAARAGVLEAMRGDGTPPFPQEARVVLGPKTRVVRISGKLGALQLSIETAVGATRDVQSHRAGAPILPVPGSLRVSPDGKFAAWVEVIGPTALVPVMTSLEKDEPAREIGFLSGGRPLRDQALAHVVSSLSGFSKDGQRLGLAIDAWNDLPGPAPRYTVVAVATGELLYETSRDLKSFQRLLQ